MDSKQVFRFFGAPTPFTSAERRWWRNLDWYLKVLIAVAISWSVLTLLYAVSDSCRRDQASQACLFTNGGFAETVNSFLFTK